MAARSSAALPMIPARQLHISRNEQSEFCLQCAMRLLLCLLANEYCEVNQYSFFNSLSSLSQSLYVLTFEANL